MTEKPVNIHTALAAAQGEMAKVTKGSTNPHFRSKYADLADLVTAARPSLSAHGICFWHEAGREETGERTMGTILCHGESGTFIRCDIPLIVQKNDMQGMKSAVTYAKRISFESVTGIAPEDDDDGNAAAAAAPKARANTGASEGLNDAWMDAVEDSLPENATGRQRSEAYADAIMRDFQKMKSVRGLDGQWTKRHDLIRKISDRHPDLSGDILHTYETCKAALEADAEPQAAAQSEVSAS